MSLLFALNSSTNSQNKNKLYVVFYPWISNMIKLAKKQTERKQEQAYEVAAANRASVAQNNFRSADTK